MTTRVLIINNDSFQLAALGAALRLHGVDVIGEAKSFTLAHNLFTSLSPDAVIIDIAQDGKGAMEFARAVRILKADLGIVMTSDCPDLRLLGLSENDVPEGIQIIYKKAFTDLASLGDSIQFSISALAGKEKMKWIDPQGTLAPLTRAGLVRDLTDIQIETLRLIAKGLSNAEIGRIRFVSEKSVEQMVSRVALHLHLNADRTKNTRVLLAGEYYGWMNARAS